MSAYARKAWIIIGMAVILLLVCGGSLYMLFGGSGDDSRKTKSAATAPARNGTAPSSTVEVPPPYYSSEPTPEPSDASPAPSSTTASPTPATTTKAAKPGHATTTAPPPAVPGLGPSVKLELAQACRERYGVSQFGYKWQDPFSIRCLESSTYTHDANVENYCFNHMGGSEAAHGKREWTCDGRSVPMNDVCRKEHLDITAVVAITPPMDMEDAFDHWLCRIPNEAGDLNLNGFCSNHYYNSGHVHAWPQDMHNPLSYRCWVTPPM